MKGVESWKIIITVSDLDLEKAERFPNFYKTSNILTFLLTFNLLSLSSYVHREAGQYWHRHLHR